MSLSISTEPPYSETEGNLEETNVPSPKTTFANSNQLIQPKLTSETSEKSKNNQNVTCSLIESNNDNNVETITKYNCEQNVSGTISKVEVEEVLNLTESPLAESMGKEIQNQQGKILEDKTIFLIKDCQIIQEKDPIKIKGILEGNSSPKEGTFILYAVQEDGSTVEIPSTLTKNGNEIEMILNPKKSLTSDLDGAIGKTSDGNVFYLSFNKDNKNSTLDYSNPYYNWNKNKKSSGGLSAGGIVGIIIPCVIVLIAVAALAFFLGRKPSIPSNQNLGNTIGITSSSQVVN